MSVMKYLVAGERKPVFPEVSGRIVIAWSVVTLKFAERNTPITQRPPTWHSIGLVAPLVSPANTAPIFRELAAAATAQSIELPMMMFSVPEVQLVPAAERPI